MSEDVSARLDIAWELEVVDHVIAEDLFISPELFEFSAVVCGKKESHVLVALS